MAQMITSATQHYRQNLASICVKGAWLRMREFVAFRRLFFTFRPRHAIVITLLSRTHRFQDG